MGVFKVGDLIKPTGVGDERALKTEVTGRNDKVYYEIDDVGDTNVDTYWGPNGRTNGSSSGFKPFANNEDRFLIFLANESGSSMQFRVDAFKDTNPTTTDTRDESLFTTVNNNLADGESVYVTRRNFNDFNEMTRVFDTAVPAWGLRLGAVNPGVRIRIAGGR